MPRRGLVAVWGTLRGARGWAPGCGACSSARQPSSDLATPAHGGRRADRVVARRKSRRDTRALGGRRSAPSSLSGRQRRRHRPRGLVRVERAPALPRSVRQVLRVHLSSFKNRSPPPRRFASRQEALARILIQEEGEHAILVHYAHAIELEEGEVDQGEGEDGAAIDVDEGEP